MMEVSLFLVKCKSGLPGDNAQLLVAEERKLEVVKSRFVRLLKI